MARGEGNIVHSKEAYREPWIRKQQPIAVGIDPGSKKEALVVASAAHTYLNIQANARTGVKEAEQAWNAHQAPQVGKGERGRYDERKTEPARAWVRQTDHPIGERVRL